MVLPQPIGDGRVSIRPAVVMTNRIIWGALLAGPATAAAVFATVAAKGNRPSPVPTLTRPQMLAITGAMLAFAIAVNVIVRLVGFGGVAADDDRAIRGRYGSLNIIAMAPLEGASFTAIMLAFVSGHAWPVGWVSVAAFAIQLSLFPRATVALRR